MALALELSIAEKLEHPNVVRLARHIDSPRSVYLVMEHLSGGELFERIVAKERYTEEEARLAVRSLATGMAYFHDLGVVHRDIKVRLDLVEVALLKRSRMISLSQALSLCSRRTCCMLQLMTMRC